MRLNNSIKFVVAVGVSELAGVIGSAFTIPAIPSWYASLAKPALNPPGWIFGPVWTALYFCIGISLFLVWKNNWRVVNPILTGRRKAWNAWSKRLWTGDLQKVNAIAIFGIQYMLNMLWPVLFFDLHFPGFAFFEILALWFAIVYTIVNFYRISKPAAYLLAPYLLWVTFAVYLNFSIWQLNG